MQYFREAVNGKLVEIDDEVFFVDGIRIPIKAIWGTKGVYYYLAENGATAVAEGVGTVVAQASGCLLGPIFGILIALIGIVVFMMMLGGSGNGGQVLLPLVIFAAAIWFICIGIGKGRTSAVEAVATKVFYILIVTKDGEHRVLEGMPEDFLQRIAFILEKVVDASRGDESAKMALLLEKEFLQKHEAAEQGDTIVQNELGVLYSSRGNLQSNQRALEFFRKAADQGHPEAQYNLGMLFFQGGKGINIDYEKSNDWFSRAMQNPLISDELKQKIPEHIEAIKLKLLEKNENIAKERKKLKFLFAALLGGIVLVLILALFQADPSSIPVPKKEQSKNDGSAGSQVKAENQQIIRQGPKLGTWEIRGEDRYKWLGILILSKREGSSYEGYVKWKGLNTPRAAGGIEIMKGEYDPKNERLLLKGVRLVNDQGLGLGVYKANVSKDGLVLSNGVWGGGGSKGKWRAKWQNEKTGEK